MRHLAPTLSAILLSCVAAASALASETPAADEQRIYTFGIVPQQAPSKLLRSWRPVLGYLQQRTGLRFVFRTAPDIPTFERRLASGEYDFAYMNPYHFTVFNRGDEGYQAVARAKEKRIRGILVVRKDSPIEELADLWGELLAFPAPAAFAASVLPRASLVAAGIPFQAQYVSSHDSVYKAVAKDLFAAGGGVVRTLNATDPDVREQLRVLWTSPGYTPHAIAADASVTKDVATRIQVALGEMDRVDAGRKALAVLKIKGFEAAKNADWDDVRALHIDTALGAED